MITVFTPVYNRAYCIYKLYQSLVKQTSKDFEWVLIDDGSTDNIEELIYQYIKEAKINIRFFKQKNGGKHRAINRGLKEARGNLFFIVDSDDYLTDNAIAWITEMGHTIENNDDFAGLSGIRIKPDGSKIVGGRDFGTIDATAIDIRLKFGVTGDLAEVYKTKVLAQYPFPEYEGEKFCPEAVIWYRIARNYKLRYCYKGIYVCEYLPDGLTAKITKLRRSSPKASMTFYSEHFHDPIPLKWKLKAAINFWRFQTKTYRLKYGMLNPLSLAAWIPGKLYRLFDKLDNEIITRDNLAFHGRCGKVDG